jgi:hypothetical protein
MGVPFFGMEEGRCGPMVLGDDPFPVTTIVETGDMIFILGRVEQALICDKCTHEHGRYLIQGLFSEQTLAEQNALDETYFIGPLPLNVGLPHDPMEWHGLYWPFQMAVEAPAPEQEDESGSSPGLPPTADQPA